MKKGFTLIELLAVIVILAIVSIVSVPIMLNVIDKAKQGSAESSALGYIDATEKQVMINKVKNNNPIDEGEYSKSELAALGLNIKGEVTDALVLINSKGKIIQARFCIDDYSIDYDGKKTVINTDDNYCDHIDSMVFVCPVTPGTEYTYSYTGDSQTFTVPCNGNYKIELWGAQGGDYTATYHGGKGAYTAGEIKLTRNQQLYVVVGGEASGVTGGYNGGGTGVQFTYNDGNPSNVYGCYRGGGGATDVRTVSGDWDNADSLKSRIMVAGAGGAGHYYNNVTYGSGGDAGGLESYEGGTSNGWTGYSATQIVGGGSREENFGIGAFGVGGSGTDSWGVSGGGSGWYGGGAGKRGSGAGGSSYISGHAGCIGVDQNGNPNATIYSSLNNSYSNTGYKFTNTVMIDGQGYEWSTEKASSSTGMPTHDGTSTMTGNSGSGYAKITYLGK